MNEIESKIEEAFLEMRKTEKEGYRLFKQSKLGECIEKSFRVCYAGGGLSNEDVFNVAYAEFPDECDVIFNLLRALTEKYFKLLALMVELCKQENLDMLNQQKCYITILQIVKLIREGRSSNIYEIFVEGLCGQFNELVAREFSKEHEK